MAEDSSDERRRTERIPINDELAELGTTWVSDLSVGGVFVHTDTPLPVGQTIELRFTVLLDDPLIIDAKAKVVRHSRRPPGMGVQFTELAPEVSLRIQEVLDAQQPLDSGAPLRLPEPSDSSTTLRLGRPAPVGKLSFAPTMIEDDNTTNFVRSPSEDDEPTTIFRAPPLPSKAAAKARVDEDARTSQFPAHVSGQGPGAKGPGGEP